MCLFVYQFTLLPADILGKVCEQILGRVSTNRAYLPESDHIWNIWKTWSVCFVQIYTDLHGYSVGDDGNILKASYDDQLGLKHGFWGQSCKPVEASAWLSRHGYLPSCPYILSCELDRARNSTSAQGEFQNPLSSPIRCRMTKREHVSSSPTEQSAALCKSVKHTHHMQWDASEGALYIGAPPRIRSNLFPSMSACSILYCEVIGYTSLNAYQKDNQVKTDCFSDCQISTFCHATVLVRCTPSCVCFNRRWLSVCSPNLESMIDNPNLAIFNNNSIQMSLGSMVMNLLQSISKLTMRAHT